jgi:hypothetical protein
VPPCVPAAAPRISRWRSRMGRKASPSEPRSWVEPSMSVKTSVTIRLPGTVLGRTPLPRVGTGTLRFRGVTENAPPLSRPQLQNRLGASDPARHPEAAEL